MNESKLRALHFSFAFFVEENSLDEISKTNLQTKHNFLGRQIHILWLQTCYHNSEIGQ